MFIHANIAHLAFNILALGISWGICRKISWNSQIHLYLFGRRNCWSFILRCNIYFHFGKYQYCINSASGAISGILGIAAAAGNTKAYYWLLLQIVFAIIGSFTAVQIAFTAHIGGFITGVLLTKVLTIVEQKSRIKYLK